jgi:hypothetical protein
MINHFTFYEAIDSEKAKKNKIYNIPKSLNVVNNIVTTSLCMEDVRKLLGNNPVIVTSWYRCWTLNDFVGGSETSQHPEGKAVDFVCPKFGSIKEIYDAIRHSDIMYDQLILEPSWIHISFNPGNDRRQCIDNQ